MGAVDSVQGNFVHKELVVLSQRYDPPVVFDQGLQRLLDDYLDLSSALFDDDVEKLRDAAGGMRERVTSLELSSKVPAAEEAWAGHQLVLQTSLHAIALATTRAERTEHFSHISEAMYCALRSFDSVDETVFVAFCPMALNGHGAYWLAKSTVIANPYMGAEMASCGEIAETLDA